MSFILTVKKKFRSWYYALNENRIVTLRAPAIMHGLKWIVSKRYGRAYFKGYYEPKIVSCLLANLKDGDSFLDVGGHAGYFSFLVSRISPSGTIITFEPDPDNSKFIEKIRVLNRVSNVDVVAKGVGSRAGELAFEKGTTSSTGRVRAQGSFRVPIVTIDDTLRGKPISGSLWLKIDVEGFGGEVIKGATQTIAQYRPGILMELHDQSDEREVLGSLSTHGYVFYNLDRLPESIDNPHCRFYVAWPGQRSE